MGKLYFKAELLDDVVLSQKTATLGDHKSLDYIPGSVFLGIAASRFYSQFGEEKAWKLFHTSKIHFCNAYPLVDGKRSVPMPLAFHSEKVPRDGKAYSIMNFIYPEAKEKEIQYRQNRNGYISFYDEDKIHVVIPYKTSRMRTAIDAETGTAAKTHLYGYESLDEGQVFVGKIEWDDSIQADIAPVIALFESGEIIRAGRSKTASYGRVKVSGINAQDGSSKANVLSGTSFSIMAVSDLCLKSPVTGTPELNVLPEFLELGDGWKLDKTRSFARSVNLCQYNAYRREIEMQKSLISKGSVFTFKSEKEITAEEREKVLSSISHGIGDNKGQGFGEIILFNVGKEFLWGKVQTNDDAEQKLSAEEQEWLTWVTPVVLSKDVKNMVLKAADDFVQICIAIKKYNCFDDSKEFWPQKAQWGRILGCAREVYTKKDLLEKLFYAEKAVIKPKKTALTELNKDTKNYNSDEEWNYEADSEGKTLRKWLMTFVEDKTMNDKETKIALQELVGKCKDKISDSNWLKDGAK